MSLATRCTSCGTVFRVVQDQLKISDGWVRCGQCAEVFNAAETLYDIDREDGASTAAPAPVDAPLASPRAPSMAQPAPARSNPPKPISLADDDAAATHDDPVDSDVAPAFSDTDVMLSADELLELGKLAGDATRADAVPVPATENTADASPAEPAPVASSPPVAIAAPSSSASAGVTPASSVTPTEPDASAPSLTAMAPAAVARRRPESPDVDIAADVQKPPVGAPRRSRPTPRKPAGSSRRRADFTDARFDSDSADSDIDDIDAEVAAALDNDPRRIRKRRPEFLRRAERAARWNSRPAKIGLALLSTVAGVALGAQVTHHFRDDAAARWPAARPALQGWCAFAGCNVEAPRAIDEVAVESTTLTQGATPDAFKLAVMLRSRGRVALTTPSVSLTLTDLNGNLISRKVMSPADFRVATVMAPGTEVALKATLSTPNARVTGYTVETFYP